ncbi:oocyst wall protein [Cryptosporidium felis]|nr:oocyst wall protein [Cryptosporidium felis]
MFWIRWLISTLLLSAVRQVAPKPGISVSHGKVISSPNNRGFQNSGPLNSSTSQGRTFVHDKGTFSPPRAQPPISPKLLCPKGYDLINGNCVFSHTIPANIECPQGYEVLKGDFTVECVLNRIVSAMFNCPNGSPPKFVENNAFCPTEIVENAIIACPPNTIQKENGCIAVESKPPGFKCPEGYSLGDDSNCKQVIETKPLLNCPPETTLEQTTMACIAKVIVEPLEVCPPGAIPVKSRDLSDMRSLLNRITSNQETQGRKLQEIPTLGSLNKGNSTPTVSGTPDINSIKTQQNDQNNGSPITNLNPGNRVPINSGPVSSQVSRNPGLNSENGRYNNSNLGSGNASEQNKLADYSNPSISSNQIDTFYQALYDSSKSIRESGGIINESLLGDEVVCLILQFADPKIVCPPGLELTKEGMCIHSDIFTPKKTCEGGIEPDSDNMCVIEKLLPAEVECPKGYTLDIITGMCVKKEEEELICPEGTTLNRGSLKCEVDPKCPDNFVLNNSTLTCENERSEPPHQKCPEGTEYDEASSSCKVKDAQLPLIMCPEGYEQKGDDCVLDKRIPASYYCPSDYYQTNRNVCVKWYQDYMLQCPPFLELKEESFAYRADLIPPPAAGRGPVLPFTGIGRRLQLLPYRGNYNSYSGQGSVERITSVPNVSNYGEFQTKTINQSPKRAYENLGSSAPIVIKSFKTRGMVCFGWGRRYKMIVSCPEGTVLLNEKCIETRITEPEFLCTKGYIYDEASSTCLFEEKISPNMECPAFMNLSVSKTGSPICIGSRRDPAEVTCPEGFEWLSETLNCRSQEFAQPKIGCVKGYSITQEPTGTYCKRTDAIKPTPSCPPEYRYDHTEEICIYEIKLHEVKERDEQLKNVVTNIRTTINV